MKDTWYKNIEGFSNQNSSSLEALIKSFRLISVCHGNWKDWILPCIGAVYVCFFADLYTHNGINEIVNRFLDIQLALLGIVFTVYSIILVFFSDEMTKLMIRIEESQKVEYLEIYTNYYADLLFLAFFSVTLTMVYKIILADGAIYAIKCELINKFFMFAYFSFVLRLLWEMKSTIYNTVCLFRLSMAVRLNSLRNKDSLK